MNIEISYLLDLWWDKPQSEKRRIRNLARSLNHYQTSYLSFMHLNLMRK